MSEISDVKTVAIVQSCYIPWKGYFDLINLADEFVLLDDRQYTRRDWRNRNRIKSPQGTQWLTIPVRVKGRYTQRIDETVVDDPDWAKRHWATIQHSYARAPYFERYRSFLSDLYRDAGDPRLSAVNRHFIEALCEELGIFTKLSWSTDYEVEGDRADRILALCRATGADIYVSGPAARSYLDVASFARSGIEVRFIDYSGYREYPQLNGPFEHEVSVIDLLLSVGPEARRFMKSFDLVAPRAA
jgi:WbqC-like protein family